MHVLIGILGIISMLLPFYLNDRKAKKKINELNNESKMNPKLYEKNEILKSKISSNVKRNKKITSKYFIIFISVLALAIIVTFWLFYAMDKYKLESDIILSVSLLSFVVVLVPMLIIPRLIENEINSIIFKLLNERYGIINKVKNPLPRIVKGKKSELGNIRLQYNYSYKISRYHCVFSNCYMEELRETSRYTESGRRIVSYHYEKIANIMEYSYNLNDLGINNIDGNILIDSDIKQMIEELSEIKIIKVSIKDECLVVEKETVFNNYNSEDAKRDVNDVELFYNKLVKKILEVK